jgi:hypothetical protein
MTIHETIQIGYVIEKENCDVVMRPLSEKERERIQNLHHHFASPIERDKNDR